MTVKAAEHHPTQDDNDYDARHSSPVAKQLNQNKEWHKDQYGERDGAQPLPKTESQLPATAPAEPCARGLRGSAARAIRPSRTIVGHYEAGADPGRPALSQSIS